MKPHIVKINELQLGDVVALYPEMAFSTAIVSNIKDGYVTLFRPYGTSADFSYSGGVIPYIGIEEYKLQINDNPITLYERKELK